MKYIHIIFWLLASNGINAMEAEHKSLASIFNVEPFTQHADIAKNLAHHCLFGKQWWYVDKEIQFCSKKQICIPYPNYIKGVSFDSTDTKIIVFPMQTGDKCCACIWNRAEETLEDLDFDALTEFYEKNNEWSDEFSTSGKAPWFHMYEEDTATLLENKFGHCTMQCFHEGQAFVVPQFRVPSGYNVYAWDFVNDKALFSLHHQGSVQSVDFNKKGIEIITASSDGTVRLWNKKNGKELLRIKYDKRVTSASFNGLGTEMVVATDDGKIQVFAQYHTDNLQQILLKKLLHVWLQLEKPSKDIDSVEKLLEHVAQQLQLNAHELHAVWESFPEHMQEVIWLSMHKKIQRYGK
jgi:hypothetical protein